MEEDVDCAVGFVFVFSSKIVDWGCVALGLGKYDEISVVYDIEDHVAGVVTYNAFRVSVKVVHEHVSFGYDSGCGFGLFGIYLVGSG